jgi:GYF domain 2
MDMQLFLSITIWLMIGSATAYFANQRGRDPWKWFMIGMLLGVLGLLLLFLLPNAKEGKLPPAVEESEYSIVELEPEPSSKTAFDNQDWYYYDHKKERQGPILSENLKALWKQGEVDEETFLWCEGMTEWKKLETLPDLYAKVLA